MTINVTLSTFPPESLDAYRQWVNRLATARLRILKRWIMRLPPEWGRTRKLLPATTASLMVVRSGSLFFQFNDRRIEAGPGSIIVYTPGIPTRFGCLSTPPPTIAQVAFEALDPAGEVLAPPDPPIGVAGMIDGCRSEGDLLGHIGGWIGDEDTQFVEHLIPVLLFRLLRERESAVLPAGFDRELHEIRQLATHDPLRFTSVSAMAHHLGLSERLFSDRFLKTYRERPRQFLLRVRMEYARHLLMDEGYNVSESADLLGYSEPSAFSRQYTRTLGHPPVTMTPRGGAGSHPAR